MQLINSTVIRELSTIHLFFGSLFPGLISGVIYPGGLYPELFFGGLYPGGIHPGGLYLGAYNGGHISR